MKTITLFTPYFRPTDEQRLQELDQCLYRNISNPCIDKIILIIDDGVNPPFDSNKIQIIRTAARPTYFDWLQLAMDLDLVGVIILANSDIFFDESVALMPSVLNGNKVFVALSRWEFSSNHSYLHKNPHWSQDVWALLVDKTEIPKLINRTKFSMGIPRCDNKIAYVFSTAGWCVRNPCNLIRTHHVHASELRAYDKLHDESILGTVAYVEPSNLLEDDSDLHFDTWTLKEHSVRAVKVNSSLAKLREEKLERVNDKDEQLPQSRKISINFASVKSIIYKTGNKIYSNGFGTRIYVKDDLLMVMPSFDPKGWTVLDNNSSSFTGFVKRQFSQVVTKIQSFISDKPKSLDDINFWQYPCKTEWQAMENHRSSEFVSIDYVNKIIKLYLPLPWATYIDIKRTPENILLEVKAEIMMLKALSSNFPYKLEVHTACQHIHWHRLMSIFEEIGITDLFLSHCSPQARNLISRSNVTFRIHPWTLFAVNFNDQTRNKMLVSGKPISERKYLASFIGAHMPHYLSDIRVRLHADYLISNPKNVFIDLGNTWHFNRVVYDSQVKRKLDESQAMRELTSDVERYNSYLSNSIFSLCPEGAGPNTLRLWESIAVGAIPVLFTRNLEFPICFADELEDCCLYWQHDSFGSDFYSWLRSFSISELQERSTRLLGLYPGIKKIACF